MKIASVINEGKLTINENLEMIENYIKEAIINKAALILFSAGTLHQEFGFNPIIDRKIALNLKDPIFERLAGLAKTHHIGLGLGFLEENEGAIYNAYIIFDESGECKDVYHACNDMWHKRGKESIYVTGESVSSWVINGLCYSILMGDDLDDEVLCAMVNALDVDICFIFNTKLINMIDNKENCLKEVKHYQNSVLKLNTNALIIKQYLKNAKTDEIISNGFMSAINMQGKIEEISELNKLGIYYLDI